MRTSVSPGPGLKPPCPDPLGVGRYIYNRSSSGHRLPEKLLWSFIVQLLSAIRAVHASGAACRMIHPNYVLLTTGNRVRLGCMGVMDVLESETRKSLQELQVGGG